MTKAKTKTKATKREPTKTPASRRWRITLLKATPAKFIGYVTREQGARFDLALFTASILGYPGLVLA